MLSGPAANRLSQFPERPVWRWSEVPRVAIAEGISARLLGGEGVTLTTVEIASGTDVPVHSHVHEQFIYVVDGALDCSIAGTAHAVHPGEVLYLPSGVEHGVRALEQTTFMEVFCPRREDLHDRVGEDDLPMSAPATRD